MQNFANPTMPARGRRIIIIVSLAYQMVFVQNVIMSVVANDLMRELAISQTGMGVLGSVYLYIYAPVMLLSGMIAAWRGPRKTLSSLFVIAGVGCLIFALSSSYQTAVLGRALIAIGMAATMTSAFTLFSRWCTPEKYSRACSVCFSIGGFGTFIGLGLCSYLNTLLGWRAVFVILAILTWAYAALMHFIIRDNPPTPSGRFLPPPPSNLGELATSLGKVAKQRDFWRIALWFASVGGTYCAFCGLWAVPWLEDVFGLSRAVSGTLVSLVGVGFVAGTPAVTWFANAVLKSYRMVAGGAGVLLALCFVLVVLGTTSMSTITLVMFFLVLGVVLNAPNTVMYSSARNLFGTKLAGITGGMFGGSGFLGGAILQVLTGWLLDQGAAQQWTPAHSYAVACFPYILCGILGAIVGFGISRKSYPGTTTMP